MAPTHHRFSSPQEGAGLADGGKPGPRKPDWLKVALPEGENFREVDRILERVRLSTVCRSARCPNQGECWGCGTATFLVMGSVCTRACRFCHVETGHPLPLEPDEPDRVAEAVAALHLRYAVITSVDRDDLPDGGAGHFGQVVEAIGRLSPETRVEVLVPDFSGRRECLNRIVASRPHVIGHNLETVERLSPSVRDRRAGYRQSLDALAYLSGLARSGGFRTKSSLMLGLGETRGEILSAMDDLRDVGVSILTLGQYLQPSPFHLGVERFVPPAEFDELKRVALEKGFSAVAAGPLVRSSYRAGEVGMERHPSTRGGTMGPGCLSDGGEKAGDHG